MSAGNYCPDCNLLLIEGDWPFCPHGAPGPFWLGDSAVHVSERAQCDFHPGTGEIRIPGRVDRPIHPKLAAEGYRRRDLTSSDIKHLEKNKGLIHEAGNYNRSGQAEKDTGSR